MNTPPLFQTERGDWTPTTDDHYTPKWIFDAMGLGFDLDVASPPGGVPWIPAKRFYTIHDDGLAQDWEGLVWCNPPFASVTAWADRWSLHTDGVFLGPLAASAWLHRLMASATSVWIPSKKIDFDAPDGGRGAISYMTFVAGRGAGAIGVERLAPYGTLLGPKEVA